MILLWQMANGVRTATNVVTPPSLQGLGPLWALHRGTVVYNEPVRSAIFFPGDKLETRRNSLTVPLVWYWHPKSNLEHTRSLYCRWDRCFGPFLPSQPKPAGPHFAAT